MTILILRIWSYKDCEWKTTPTGLQTYIQNIHNVFVSIPFTLCLK